MKIIYLTKGYHTEVDDEDYDYLNQWKWHVQLRQNGEVAAVRRNIITDKGQRGLQMHRVLLSLTDKNILCDHIDRNPLNNQKSNLRVCNKFENGKNRTSAKGSTSKFLGVGFLSKKNRWIAQIRIDKKLTYLGCFKTEEEAGKCYDQAAQKYHKEFANLNFK